MSIDYPKLKDKMLEVFSEKELKKHVEEVKKAFSSEFGQDFSDQVCLNIFAKQEGVDVKEFIAQTSASLDTLLSVDDLLELKDQIPSKDSKQWLNVSTYGYLVDYGFFQRESGPSLWGVISNGKGQVGLRFVKYADLWEEKWADFKVGDVIIVKKAAMVHGSSRVEDETTKEVTYEPNEKVDLLLFKPTSFNGVEHGDAEELDLPVIERVVKAPIDTMDLEKGDPIMIDGMIFGEPFLIEGNEIKKATITCQVQVNNIEDNTVYPAFIDPDLLDVQSKDDLEDLFLLGFKGIGVYYNGKISIKKILEKKAASKKVIQTRKTQRPKKTEKAEKTDDRWTVKKAEEMLCVLAVAGIEEVDLHTHSDLSAIPEKLVTKALASMKKRSLIYESQDGDCISYKATIPDTDKQEIVKRIGLLIDEDDFASIEDMQEIFSHMSNLKQYACFVGGIVLELVEDGMLKKHKKKDVYLKA